jgi:hypothetical protein
MNTAIKTARSSAPDSRRTRAVETFQSAALTIGKVMPGMSLFGMTRGQFSMIDVVLHLLEQVGPARLSLWTWTIADYEIECFTSLMNDGRLTGGTLVIDHGARNKNAPLIARWKSQFGADSVRYVLNHSKIATLQTDTMKLVARGSMNLNFNPRFEQFDVTEGPNVYDLIREIEDELPVLPDNCSGKSVYKASKVADAFEPETLELFSGVKRWAK